MPRLPLNKVSLCSGDAAVQQSLPPVKNAAEFEWYSRAGIYQTLRALSSLVLVAQLHIR